MIIAGFLTVDDIVACTPPPRVGTPGQGPEVRPQNATSQQQVSGNKWTLANPPGLWVSHTTAPSSWSLGRGVLGIIPGDKRKWKGPHLQAKIRAQKAREERSAILELGPFPALIGVLLSCSSLPVVNSNSRQK